MATSSSSSSYSYYSIAVSTITLPLTTLFTPPPNCIEPIVSASEVWQTIPDDTHWPGHTYSDIFKVEPTCYPSGFDVISRYYQPIFSPGVCPSGFTTARVQSSVDGSTTATYATCCPSAAFLGLARALYCKSSPAATLTTVDANNQTTLATSQFVLLVPPLTVGWQSSDVSLYPAIARAVETGTPTITTSSTSTGADTTSASTSTNASSTSQATATQTNSGSLSTGAKAGIGVGVAVGALAVIGLLVWAIFARRKRRRGEWADPSAPSALGHPSAAPKYEMQPRSNPSEMGSPDPSELDGTQRYVIHR